MKITILSVGKIKEKYFTEAINEYEKRISKYALIDNITIPDEPAKIEGNIALENEAMDIEGKKIIKSIPKGSLVIVLDIKGEALDSVSFSKKLEEFMNQNSHLTFIIGGSYGLSDEVKKIADYKLSFSHMTFPHMLMKVILTEQIFRAFKILKNEKYHK